MTMKNQHREEAIEWLLEADDPGVRYLALRDLMELSEDDGELLAAQELAHKKGPIAELLDEMDDAGYWLQEGPGYHPKYRGTVWCIIILAQLGASMTLDKRIERGVEYLLDNTITENGQFSITGRPPGTIDCLQGNLCAALLDLGIDDPRLEKAFEWLARSNTGDGVAPSQEKESPYRYHSNKCGPDYACGYNGKLQCAWGAIKAMLAFSRLPKEKRTYVVEDAVQRGVEFLLSIDPVEAEYPRIRGKRPNGNWWKFGFPLMYVSDVLQNVEALVRLGYGQDARLSNAIELIIGKQDDNGRWPLEHSYAGKTWIEFGEKKQPNKWVTLRALWVLKNLKR